MSNRTEIWVNNANIAYNIRRLRLKNGVSQRALAAHLNIKSITLSRVETLAVQRISGSMLDAIEQFFNVPQGSLDLPPEVRDVPPSRFVSRKKVISVTKFCRICGASLYDDSQFCHACGTKVLP